jgi:hypothetical protein
MKKLRTHVKRKWAEWRVVKCDMASITILLMLQQYSCSTIFAFHRRNACKSYWYAINSCRRSSRYGRRSESLVTSQRNGNHILFMNTVKCNGTGRAQSIYGTGYGLDSRGVGVRVPVGVRLFSSLHRPGPIWGPPSFLSNFPGDEEVDHSPPTSAEIRNKWIYTSTPPHVFMA